jgi:hypothetical protein
MSRRTAILSVATTTTTSTAAGWLLLPDLAQAAGADTKIDGSFDIDEFLRTGIVAQPMGVSGQSGTYERAWEGFIRWFFLEEDPMGCSSSACYLLELDPNFFL